MTTYPIMEFCYDPKKLGATGRVTPKCKSLTIRSKIDCRIARRRAEAQEAYKGAPQAAQRVGGALRLRRSTELRRGRRRLLLEAALRQHGVGGLDLLLSRLEDDFGDELRLDVRLEKLLDADPPALVLAGVAR